MAVSADSAVAVEVLAAAARVRAGKQMRTREFLSKLEHDRIVHAIREARIKDFRRDSRLYSARQIEEPIHWLLRRKSFTNFGMHKTRERNAVLIFVAPRAHKFAVVGDKAIHEKCGDEFWQRVVEGMRTHFQNEKFSHALVDAIKEIGKLLAAHFPKTLGNANELPDDVIEDSKVA